MNKNYVTNIYQYSNSERNVNNNDNIVYPNTMEKENTDYTN